MSTALPIIPDARYRLYTASSNQTVFSIAFPFLQDADIQVTKIPVVGDSTVLSRPTHYTQTGKGNPLGGSITLKTGVPAGTKILISGKAVLGRSTSVVRGGKFSSAALDEDLDRLTIIAQEQQRDIDRSVKVSEGGTAPTLTPGANGTLAKWDANGNLVAGPPATALDNVEAALGIEAGRALVYPATGEQIYNAGGRRIGDLADAVYAQEAATKSQLDTAIGGIDLSGIAALAALIEGLEDELDELRANTWQTGDIKLRASTAAVTGWLLMDAKTIGDADSGATGRANADTWPLFELLHGAFDNSLLTIQTSAGAPTTRGVSAAADYAAHRRLPLPEPRGEFLRILDGGRGVDSGRVLGSAQAQQLLQHNHSASFSGNALPGHGHTTNFSLYGSDIGTSGPADGGGGITNTHAAATEAASAGTPTGSVTVNNSTGGAENRVRNVAYPLFIKL